MNDRSKAARRRAKWTTARTAEEKQEDDDEEEEQEKEQDEETQDGVVILDLDENCRLCVLIRRVQHHRRRRSFLYLPQPVLFRINSIIFVSLIGSRSVY